MDTIIATDCNSLVHFTTGLLCYVAR